MKTAWDMTQEEREALWAANDAIYAFEADDPWEAAQDMIEERRAIEGRAFDMGLHAWRNDNWCGYDPTLTGEA